MIILRGDPQLKHVALLFDDGPNPAITPLLLDVLREKNVPANFFLIGMRAEQSPELVRQIADEGHEIGNHTYTHKRLPQVLLEHGTQAVLEEVNKAQHAVDQALGMSSSPVTFLRPPYLDWNDDLSKLLAPLYGSNIMMSGLAVGDWDWGSDLIWDKTDQDAISQQSKRIEQTWKQAVSNGTLLGFHDSSEHNLPGNKQSETWMHRALPTLNAIPQIIDFLQSEGYEIKKLSDMNLITVPYKDLRN